MNTFLSPLVVSLRSSLIDTKLFINRVGNKTKERIHVITRLFNSFLSVRFIKSRLIVAHA